MAKNEIVNSLKSLNADDELRQVGARIKQLRRKRGYTSAQRFAN
jgi:hypothetical protein